MRNEPRLLRVYVYAPYEVRVKNCIDYFGMNEKEAVKAVHDADKARESYHRKYIPNFPGHIQYLKNCLKLDSFRLAEV